LNGLSPKELIEAKEEKEEFGGYFIINGIERIIRLLILQRAHQVLF
jgi:DNA-directed RNA polymerase I subunit RPA2